MAKWRISVALSVDARGDSDSVVALSVSGFGHNEKFSVATVQREFCNDQLPKCAKSSGLSRPYRISVSLPFHDLCLAMPGSAGGERLAW